MTPDYVHGYDPRESLRLQDQAATLAELLHSDTAFPAGSRVLEAGCGVGAQTVTLAKNSPGARILAVDISSDSLAEAERAVRAAGLTNVEFQQADILRTSFEPGSFDHVFVCFVLEHLREPEVALEKLRGLLRPAAAAGPGAAARPGPVAEGGFAARDASGHARGKDTGSRRSSATGATEDDASRRPVRTRRPQLRVESRRK